MDRLPYGHTVRGIVYNENNEILLLKRHPKSRTNPNKWELPGGKVDPGEFFDEALIREFKEETGLDVVLGDFYHAIQDDFPHKRTVVTVLELEIKPKTSKKITISNEHVDYMWCKTSKILEFELSSSLIKLLESKPDLLFSNTN